MREGGAIEQENNGRRAASPSTVCKSLAGLGDNRKIGATGGRKTGEIEREIIVFSLFNCSQKSNLFTVWLAQLKTSWIFVNFINERID